MSRTPHLMRFVVLAALLQIALSLRKTDNKIIDSKLAVQSNTELRSNLAISNATKDQHNMDKFFESEFAAETDVVADLDLAMKNASQERQRPVKRRRNEWTSRQKGKKPKASKSSNSAVVVIIGGGPVGLFTGLELANRAFDVTVLENTVYEALWSQNDHFTRTQILLVQDDAASGYQSLTRLRTLLSRSLWQDLMDRSCAFVPPPVRGTMTCTHVDAQWESALQNGNAKLSISIRELQQILYKAFIAAGGKVHFVKSGLSFVDHRGHVFYTPSLQQFGLSENQVRVDWLGLYSMWNRCGARGSNGVLESMDNLQFARCWKMFKHPDDDAELSSSTRVPDRVATSQRMLNMIHGDDHPLNCKAASLHQPAGSCRMDRGTWLNIMRAREIKPDVLVCADGKNGECRNIVGLGKTVQKLQGLTPVDHKKNHPSGHAFAMLFQVAHGQIPSLLRQGSTLSSTGGPLLEGLEFRTGVPFPASSPEAADPQNWPRVQHRFRAFPSRYYSGSQEDFYFAAALTAEEFEDYKVLCGMVGQAKCEGHFGYYPQKESAQIGLQDTCDGVASGQKAKCEALQSKMLTIFASILAWTNVPVRYWGDVVRGARMSAFKIFFLNANYFARSVPNVRGKVLAFAVGDAAMDVHFFSGSGVNMGFKAARLLTDLLGQWNGSPGRANHRTPADAGSGAFAASVHQEARAFSDQQHPNPDQKITDAKNMFIAYDNALRAHLPPLHTIWLYDDQLLQEYHSVMQVALLHKHMEASYNVLHAATYQPVAPGSCASAPKTCLSCPALNCAEDDQMCLWPVTNNAIALTQNQRRIMNFLVKPGRKDYGTICALRETYR